MKETYRDKLRKVDLTINGKDVSFIANQKEMLRLVAKEIRKEWDIYRSKSNCLICNKQFVIRARSVVQKYCGEKCRIESYRNRCIESYNKEHGTNHTSWVLVNKLKFAEEYMKINKKEN